MDSIGTSVSTSSDFVRSIVSSMTVCFVGTDDTVVIGKVNSVFDNIGDGDGIVVGDWSKFRDGIRLIKLLLAHFVSELIRVGTLFCNGEPDWFI